MRENPDYKADLLADLRNDPGYAAKYLSAAIADSKEAFLVALRDVAEAQKGIAQVACEARVNRENLYRTLSEAGNPRLTTLLPILSTLGFRIVVEPELSTSIDAVAYERDSGTQGLVSVKTHDISMHVGAQTWEVTTTFSGTLLGPIRDRDLPAFEATEVPVHLLTVEKTSEVIEEIQ